MPDVASDQNDGQARSARARHSEKAWLAPSSEQQSITMPSVVSRFQRLGSVNTTCATNSESWPRSVDVAIWQPKRTPQFSYRQAGHLTGHTEGWLSGVPSRWPAPMAWPRRDGPVALRRGCARRHDLGHQGLADAGLLCLGDRGRDPRIGVIGDR